MTNKVSSVDSKSVSAKAEIDDASREEPIALDQRKMSNPTRARRSSIFTN